MVQLHEDDVTVVMSTSNASDYPPENVFDGDSNTFWLTTGLFPQVLVAELSQSPQAIKAVKLLSNGIRSLTIEGGEREDSFELLASNDEMPPCGNGEQFISQRIQLRSSNCRFFRFVIRSGYDHYAAVQSIEFES